MTGSEWNDGAFVAALRARNPGVARPLWQRYAPSVFRILRRTLGPDAQIDDAVHHVFLRVFRRGRRLRPHSSLNLFVMRAVARTAHGRLSTRAVRRLRSRPDARLHLERAAPDQATPESEVLARFYRLLDRLGATDRIVFVLHFMEGLELPEIATAIGGSSARTERRLRRSLDTLTAGIARDSLLARWARSPHA